MLITKELYHASNLFVAYAFFCVEQRIDRASFHKQNRVHWNSQDKSSSAKPARILRNAERSYIGAERQRDKLRHIVSSAASPNLKHSKRELSLNLKCFRQRASRYEGDPQHSPRYDAVQRQRSQAQERRLEPDFRHICRTITTVSPGQNSVLERILVSKKAPPAASRCLVVVFVSFVTLLV